MRHMHDTSQPELIDRRVREDWEARGSSDMYQRAMEKARGLLETHPPEPLPDDVLAEVREHRRQGGPGARRHVTRAAGG